MPEKTVVILNETTQQFEALTSPGTSGDVLKSNGTDAVPSWLTPPWLQDPIGEWIGITQQTVTYNSGTTTVDWSLSNKAKLTMSGNIATLAMTNPPSTGNCVLILVHSGAGRTITTWDVDILWANGGTAPTLSPSAGDVDVISAYWDGTNYLAMGSFDFA